MQKDTTKTQVMSMTSRDVLTDILRHGAQEMLATAIENEVAQYIADHESLRDACGYRLVVRNGRLPARTIQTGVGPVEVQQPRVNDRQIGENGQRIRFSSKILPPYLRRTKSIDELIPWLYLKGISTGDFTEALQALLGPQASGLSATNQGDRRLNHDRLNIDGCKEYGIAFGEAVFMSSPPSRSQIRDAVTWHRLAESGFGGWADEKIKTAREAAPLLSREKIQSTTFDNISVIARPFSKAVAISNTRKWRLHRRFAPPKKIAGSCSVRVEIAAVAALLRNDVHGLLSCVCILRIR